MINMNLLRCIFADAVYDYVLKIGAGVSCNVDKLECEIATSYNYSKIAENHPTCDITPSTYSKIISYQNQSNNSITFETCC